MAERLIYKRTDGKWAWRLTADNGQIIATDAGQGYALTDAGRQALTAKRLPTTRATPVSASSTTAFTPFTSTVSAKSSPS